MPNSPDCGEASSQEIRPDSIIIDHDLVITTLLSRQTVTSRQLISAEFNYGMRKGHVFQITYCAGSALCTLIFSMQIYHLYICIKGSMDFQNNLALITCQN